MYVAYSGGKDSTVVLHLAYRVLGSVVDVFHWDHGPYLMPRVIEEEIIRNARLIAPKATLIVRTFKLLWEEEARWDYARWYRSFFPILERLSKERGWEVGLLGLRREESVTRKLCCASWCEARRGIKLCFPIRKWTWRDVWAYIIEHELPYPSVYDKYAELIGYDKARLVTFLIIRSFSGVEEW